MNLSVPASGNKFSGTGNLLQHSIVSTLKSISPSSSPSSANANRSLLDSLTSQDFMRPTSMSRRSSDESSGPTWQGKPVPEDELSSPMDCAKHVQDNASVGEWQPRVDIRQDGSDMCVSLELPGVSRENIVVECSGGWLRISGSRAELSATDRSRIVKREISRGRFQRALRLPLGAEVVEDSVALSAGILQMQVKLPHGAASALPETTVSPESQPRPRRATIT